MTALHQAKPLVPSSLFGGILSDKSYVALTLILVEQFLTVFAPVITRLLSFLQVLVYSEADVNAGSSDSSRSQYSFDSDAVNGEKGAPIVSKTYARFIDDKKPTIGTKSDIKKLEDFGYDKYRFLSKSFMKRNNIVREKD
jgi:hypothetical protein